jgi:hypothetical protein
MTYRLEIMPPGSSSGKPFASFDSETPFMPLGCGEIIEPNSFSEDAKDELFRVLSVLHRFEKDEQGHLVQVLCVYTSKIYDCASTRSELIRRI